MSFILSVTSTNLQITLLVVTFLVAQVSSSTSSSPVSEEKDMFLREVKIGEKFITDLPLLHYNESQQYLKTIGYKRDMVFELAKDVDAFTLSCKSDSPVYWIFHQDENFPQRDDPERDNQLTLYTEVTATATPPKSHRSMTTLTTNKTTKFEVVNYLANLQVSKRESKFTGMYSCVSAKAPETERISLYIYIPDTQHHLLFYNENIQVTYHHAQHNLTLPCLVNSPDSDIKIQLYKLVTTNTSSNKTSEEKELWTPLSTNKSIEYNPKVGFLLHTKDLPTIMGRYRCIRSVSKEEAKHNDFVNITIVPEEKSAPLIHRYPLELEHYGNEMITTVINGTASYTVKKVPARYTDFNRLPTFSTPNYFDLAIECCSNTVDHGEAKVFHRQCHNPSHCLALRKLVSTGQIADRHMYTSMRRGCTSSTTSMDFASVIQCAGEGIYILDELIPSFTPFTAKQSVQEAKGYRYHFKPQLLFDDFNYNTYNHKIPIICATSMKLFFLDETSNSFLKLGLKALKNIVNPRSNRTRIILQCDFLEYHITFGLFWELLWGNGTSRFIKAEQTDLFETEDQGFKFREAVDEYGKWHARPVLLKMEVGTSALDNLKSVTCHAPLWSKEGDNGWTSVSIEVPQLPPPVEMTFVGGDSTPIASSKIKMTVVKSKGQKS